MKKSYKGLVVWLVLYLLGFVPIIMFVPDGKIAVKLVMWYTSVMITLLMLLIRNTDSVYWINGVDFKTAEKAGYEKRMEFAQAHLDKFSKHTVFFTIYAVIGYFLGFGALLDTVVFTVSLVAVAFSTINIRLK